jgi:hypothetical protein
MQRSVNIPVELLFKTSAKDLSLASLYAYYELVGFYDFREASKVTGIPVTKIGNLTATLIHKGYINRNDINKIVNTTCENFNPWFQIIKKELFESEKRKENKELIKSIKEGKKQ